MRQADGALAGARNFAVLHACLVGAVRGDDGGAPLPDAHDVEAAARAHRYVARLARERKALDDLAVYDDFNLRRIKRVFIYENTYRENGRPYSMSRFSEFLSGITILQNHWIMGQVLFTRMLL